MKKLLICTGCGCCINPADYSHGIGTKEEDRKDI